jgi:hypothetical protein
LGSLWELLLERLPGHQRRERFGELVSEYHTFPYAIRELPANRQACDTIEGVIRHAAGRQPSWTQINRIDRALLTMLTGEDLKRRARRLRNEFQLATKLVPADEILFETYRNSRAAEGNETGEAALKADALTLQELLHALYANRRLQLRTRNSIALWTGILFVVATIFTLKIDKIFDLQTMLFDVLGVGMLGGLFSTLLRVQNFKLAGIREATSLTEVGNRTTVVLAPAIGGAGAVVLFVVFMSGFLQGSFLPTLPVIPFRPDTDYLEALFNIQIPSSLDAAKLYLLCFLAGFSERLVPDMMSRLTAMADKQGG